MRGVLWNFISAFESCAVDVFRALRGSWFISLGLFGFYFASFTLGLLIGAASFEALRPVVIVASANLSSGTRLAIELSFLFLLLFSACFVTCAIARLLVRLGTYLIFEVRESAFFFTTMLATILCTMIAATAGITPAVFPEQLLVQIAGCSGLGAITFGLLVAWILVRYRSTSSRTRSFDHDIGIALDHMTDARRARFSFYRSGV